MSTGNNVVNIIKSANSDAHGKFDIKSIISSVGFSLIISAALILAFSALRPRNNVVYAPKVKYADEKHQPPKLEKTPWAWIRPIYQLREEAMLGRVGLDAVVFLRFIRLCRNYFAIIAIVSCSVLIPINIIGTNATLNGYDVGGKTNPLLKLTVSGITGHWLYTHIAMSYVCTLILMFFIWRNYRTVVHLRQKYFSSDEYQASMHARTIMMIDLPEKQRNDNALAHKAIQLKNAAQFSQAQVGRDVGKLPALIEKHEEAVRKLEGYLAKYLKNPAKLPAHRPTCKSSTGRVDAIDYYTNRVQSLENQIETARETYEGLHSQSYGFVSYPSIPTAHLVTKANKDKRLFLAPKPLDILWKNLGRAAAKRHSNRIFGNTLFVIFCFLWTIPNALIATFISNIYNLGSVWPWFQARINEDPTLWAILQGILAPIILGIFYSVLPSIMRRISEFEGSLTKNKREHKVFHKLFLFFFINNFVIFTLFGVLWSFVQTTIVVTAQDQTGISGFWRALKASHFFDGLANSVTSTSTFWIIYVAQRNLGCLLDLLQAWGLLLKWFKRTFMSPSPREMIEWSAPQNFDYASYYNSFLYNFTICISYATLAPLILPFGFLYFAVSGFTYKYTMLYVQVTKVESGGGFWRILVNRLLLSVGFSNVILFIIVWVKINIFVAISVAPILFILLFFKIYLVKSMDPSFNYYLPVTVDEAGNVPVVHRNDQKKDRLRSRFGHPSLHQKLIVPMVHERSRHLLREVYKGRLNDDEFTPAVANVDAIQEKFELVGPQDLDFEAYKNRPEFAMEHGDIYDDATSVATAIQREGTPRTGLTSLTASPYSDMTPPHRRPVVQTTPSGYSVRKGSLNDYDAYSYAESIGREEDYADSTYELETFRGRPMFADDDQETLALAPRHTGVFGAGDVTDAYDSQEDLTNLLRPGYHLPDDTPRDSRYRRH